MRQLILTISLLISTLGIAQEPFKGLYTNKELNLRLQINLYEQNIAQPQFEDEMCYGILSGALNGRWIILKIMEKDDDKAVVRAVSDSGVEAQTLEIKIADETLEIRQTGSTNIRGVKNSKYTKLPKNIVFTKVRSN